MIKFVSSLLVTALFISCGKELKDTKKEPSLGSTQPSAQTEVDNVARQTLYYAIESNDGLQVESILGQNLNVDFQFVDGETPLIMAIRKARTDVIVQILNKTKNLDLKNAKGETPLIKAIKNNNTFVVRLLSNRKVDLNLADDAGLKPLEHAIYKSNQQLVLNLIKNGADIHIVPADQKSVMELAEHFQLTEVMELLPLIENHTEVSSKMLNDAIKSGNHNFLEYLLINHREYRDLIRERNVLITAMNINSQSDRERMLKTLLAKGADPNNNEGVLPLIHAVESEQQESVETLLLYANPFLTDDMNLTALHYAVELNNYAIVEKVYLNMVAKSTTDIQNNLSLIVTGACQSRPRIRRPTNQQALNLRYITNLLRCY